MLGVAIASPVNVPIGTKIEALRTTSPFFTLPGFILQKLGSHNHELFDGIDSPFDATRYHSLIVDKKSLPKTLKINSISKDNIIMGISNSKAKAYGVQFHPESIESQFGHKIIKNFINICEKK